MLSRKEYMYWQNRKDRVSEYICVRASGASERFLEFFIVLQLKRSVSLYTINVILKVILSSKSGGGDVCTGHPPHPKKWGGGGSPPPSPRDLRQYMYIIKRDLKFLYIDVMNLTKLLSDANFQLFYTPNYPQGTKLRFQ